MLKTSLYERFESSIILVAMLKQLEQENLIIIKQRKELVEFLGFETRNKYEIYNQTNQLIGFAAEQQKGFLGILLRQIFGHWRNFDIHIFNSDRVHQFVAHHPFRFYFQRLEVFGSNNERIGYLEKRFSILTKKFDVFDEFPKLSSTMHSGLFRIWTFPFLRNGKEIAKISKKWGGAIKEMFLDADNFVLEFLDPSLTPKEKAVLLNAALFVDLLYFENNQGRFSLGDILPRGS